MQALHVVGILYFVLLFFLINWKGRAFLDLPILKRSIVALVAGILWAAWIVALYLTT